MSRFLGVLAVALCTLAPAAALAQPQEQDLPGRVGRVADLAGELYLAPQDRPDDWNAVGVNYPVAGGDNLWVGNDGRAEIDFGGGQLRLAGDTNVHVSRLDDRQFALFIAQGRVALRVRVLDPGDSAYIDTPNAQITLTRPGLYRIDVSEGRDRTQLVVREGEANVLTQGTLQQVLPGQSAMVDGPDPRYAEVVNGIGIDGFDSWVASRDRRYSGRSNYVSPQMVGAADLDHYGTWTQAPEYGALWYPNDVPADWAPYRNGYWTDVGAWGPTWVDYAPWGYAPFHYGRWVFWNGRWAWAPGRYVARPIWAPALVGWTGGSGWSVSIGIGGPVFGWVPLAWGEPYRPWWGRCTYGCWERYNRPYNVNVTVNNYNNWKNVNSPPPRYVNASRPGGMTAVSQAAFTSRQPVQANLVRLPREAAVSAPVLASAPPVRATQPSQASARPLRAPQPASAVQQSYARPAPAAASVGTRPLQPGTDLSRGRAPSTTAVQPQQGQSGFAPSQPAARAQPQQGQPGFAPSQPAARQAQPYARPEPTSPSPSSGYATRSRGQESMTPPPAQRQAVQPPSMPQQPMQRQAQPSPPPAQRMAPQAAPQPQFAQPAQRAAPQAQPQMQPQQRAAPQAQPQMQPQQRAAPQAQPQMQPAQRAAPQVQPSPPPQAQGNRGGGDSGGSRGRGDEGGGGGGGQANRAPR